MNTKLTRTLTTDNNETFIEEIEWSDWKRTFLFLPKTTITGNEIIGFAWTRMIELGVHEYEGVVGYYISPGREGIQYARNKKEIFVHNMKGVE